MISIAKIRIINYRHPSGCFSNANFHTACTAPALTYFRHGNHCM
nr:MAG TPA: hypothetical protein [Caudoviricetes sp.]